MSAFEFLFSFYGLLLGLALTEVIGGFSRALNERAWRPIGWLTPLLAVVLTLDLMTFWAAAWRDMRDVAFTADLLLVAGIGPIIYYFAAKQAFPDSGSEAASLDEHFFRHRGWVLGGVIIANQISYLPDILEPSVLRLFLSNFVYVAPLAAAALIRVRWLIAVILVGEIGWLLYLLLVRL
ncbi:MAG: hypothetical protein EON88_02930 [Brevundimonas sp.]|nr:MAG: hypothetical protein EON88_02930 [Brevundimonas sp.]